jgi:Mn2+/Fe2+ NRAMP family transporter
LVGTTITPWMQFYLQASIVEKGVDRRHYALTRLDVILGCVVTDVIAFFIVVACAATIYKSGGGTIGGAEIRDAADAAKALIPFAGHSPARCSPWTGERFAAGRGHPAAGYGLQHLRRPGLRSRRRSALFRGAYFLLAVYAADRGRRGFVLIPRLPLLKVILFSQVANGILLPFVLFYMLTLINRKRIMQEYVNNWWQNAVAWSTAIVMVGLTAALVWAAL